MQKYVKNKLSGKIKRWSSFLAALTLIFSISLTGFAAESGTDAMSAKRENSETGMMLRPGGMPFGVKITTSGVLIAGISGVKNGGKTVEPASAGGLRVKDIIISVNGKEVGGSSDVSAAVEGCGGDAVTFTVMRNGKSRDITVTPVRDDNDGIFKIGLWLRDSTAGIGTVTFIAPDTGTFGGLGHGICDVDTGVLMPLRSGSAMKVKIGGVVRGRSGKPGELKGYFLPERSGNVFSNTLCGVFGIFTEIPSDADEPIPVGSRYDIEEGSATILCTLGDDGRKSYDVNISKIDRDGTDNKNFVVTVTDKALIERTGGIVQGMSGSPIIQNGKLVGAVTHVLVSDAKVGYGIFIENMLNQMPQ